MGLVKVTIETREHDKITAVAKKCPEERITNGQRDDEVELLLSVTNDYKVSKAAESIDWESCS